MVSDGCKARRGVVVLVAAAPVPELRPATSDRLLAGLGHAAGPRCLLSLYMMSMLQLHALHVFSPQVDVPAVHHASPVSIAIWH